MIRYQDAWHAKKIEMADDATELTGCSCPSDSVSISRVLIVVCAVLIILLASCLKDKAAPINTDRTDPTFDMVMPMAGDTFYNGDTIWIHVVFFDDVELYKTGVRVFQNGVEILEHFDISSDTIHVHGHHVNINITAQTTFEVKAEAEDAAGNKAEMVRVYTVDP